MAGTNKKSAPKRKTTYKKKAPMRKKSMVDGQSILVNAYCEVHKNLDPATEGAMSYSINIDPKNAKLIGGAGVTATKGDANGTALGENLVYNKFNTFSSLFNQYRVNSATIRVRVDTECGLENAVITCNDKGDGTVIESMSQAVTGAHKPHSMTQSRRELSYTIKTTGQERDFLSTNDNQNQSESEKKYIKVFQKLPKGENTKVCEHQVSMLLSLTLKDTKNDLN